MSASDEAVAEAAARMARFADRTGLTSDEPPVRYLWTDAFAVCNYLALARATGEERYADLALRLVAQVHHVLGRHRADDPRSGWISGLDDARGERHPTRGGLRIGKALPERPPDAPVDESLEWDRDGQYFHYLTRWMHALDQTSRSARQPRLNAWARELADAAHRAFTTGPPGARRMVWKMSIDLARPLVASMGHHDPLDGFLTCVELQTTAHALADAPHAPDLKDAVADFGRLTEGRDWTTADPLGLGGLLMDASRVDQLTPGGALDGGALLDALLAAAHRGLSHYARQGEWRQAASRRLAFRELGLAIGISAIPLLPRSAHTEALGSYVGLGEAIRSFWLEPRHQCASTWTEHLDINEVMLATALLPEGVLRLQPIRERE